MLAIPPIALASTLAAAPPTPLPSAAAPWSRPELVSRPSVYRSVAAALVTDAAGGVHVVWEESDSGDDADVLYAHRPPAGPWGEPELVSKVGYENAYSPRVAVGAGGTVHVVWYEQVRDQGYMNFDIHYTFKAAGETYWRGPQVVSSESTYHSYAPDVAVDGAGTVHVVWHDFTPVRGYYEFQANVFYSRMAEGGDWEGEEVLSLDSHDHSMAPRIAVDGAGRAHVVWYDGDDVLGSGPDWDILYRTRHAGGTWAPMELVSGQADDSSRLPSLAIGPNGTVHVVWEQVHYPGGPGRTAFDVFYNARPEESPWGGATLVSDWNLEEERVWGAEIAVDATGGLHLVAEEDVEGTGTRIVYLSRALLAWSRPEVISNPRSRASTEAALAVDAGGGVHVVGSDPDDFGGWAGTDLDVFYRERGVGFVVGDGVRWVLGPR